MRFSIIAGLLLVGMGWATADPIVVWPKPVPPPGISLHSFPVPPVAWPEYFQERLNRKAKAGRVDLLFDGDSITDHWPGQAPEIWQAHFGDRHPFDAAIGGDGVEHALWRVDHGQVEGLNPRLIVLLIGTNNIQAHTPDEVIGGIKALVADYRQRCPQAHILLMGIFPRGHRANDPLRAKITQANQGIAAFADGSSVLYLDIGAKLLEPDGTLAPEMMPDFLHPTAKGYEIWAQAIQPIVDRYCPRDDSGTAAALTAPAPAPASFVISWPLPEPPPGTNPLTFPQSDLDWIGHWFARFQNNLNRGKTTSYDLIFDGDAGMERLQTVGQDTWKARYGSMKAADFAIEGQIENNLWRVQHGQLDGQDPKLVVLMFTFHWPNDPAGELVAAVKLLLQEYETRCPHAHVVLLAKLPRGEARSPLRLWGDSINQAFAALDDGKRVSYVDLGAKFRNPDGSQIAADFGPDGMNPSVPGYAVWADALQPTLDTFLPKKSTP